jgi:hypothetical protein
MERTQSEETEAAGAPFRVAAQNEPVKLCGSPLRKKPGVFCRKPAGPNGRCVLHGQNARRGPEHARWKSGAFSKYLPRDLRKRYEAWLQDAELLASRNEVAMLKARLQELSSRLSTGETADAWGRLRETLAKAKAACDARDEAALRAAVAEGETITEAANANEAAWEAFTTLAERSTLIAQREARRLLEARLYVSAQEVRFLVASLAGAVIRHADAKTRLAISDEFKRLNLGGFDEWAAQSVGSDHGQPSDAGETT